MIALKYEAFETHAAFCQLLSKLPFFQVCAAGCNAKVQSVPLLALVPMVCLVCRCLIPSLVSTKPLHVRAIVIAIRHLVRN